MPTRLLFALSLLALLGSLLLGVGGAAQPASPVGTPAAAPAASPVASPVGAARPLPLDGARRDAFAAFVVASLAELGAPGAAVAVVQGGEVVFLEGYGVREAGGGRRRSRRTP